MRVSNRDLRLSVIYNVYGSQSPIESSHNKTAPNATIPARTGASTPIAEAPLLFGENAAVVAALRWLVLDVVSAATLVLNTDTR